MGLTNLNSPPDETRWHLKEVPRWGGGVHDKNVNYSVGNHASMATDTVRCTAYAEAIGRVARGRRCLDVGTGPFLLLARLCERAGASFVACVEDSPSAVRLAIELLKREQLEAHPESRWEVDEDLDEECRQHLSTIRRTCGALLPLRTLQLRRPQPPSHPPAPPSPLLPTVLASTRGVAVETDATVLALYTGLSSRTALPGGIDLLVHEILGHVASSEGVVRAVRELRGRPGLLAPGCSMIPQQAGTMLAPTAELTPAQLAACAELQPPQPPRVDASSSADAASSASTERAVEGAVEVEVDASARVRHGMLHHVVGFPAEAMLAPAEAMEWYDFTAPSLEAGLPEEQRTTCTFTTLKAAHFSGVHLHLKATLDEHTCIDSREQDTTWSCIYIRLLAAAEAVWLPQGSTIQCSCRIDVRGECSHYALDVSAAPPGEALAAITSFAWSGDG